MISIIIPVLNEEAQILKLLTLLGEHSSKFIHETIVVDGGSSDKTAQLVEEKSQVILINSEKGRARQMNAGAKFATGKILYFLHADSVPPKDFDLFITEEYRNLNKAGCFCMKFDKDHWLLNLMGWFTKINHKACRGGDQSLFVEKQLFDEIGGFDESFIVYEDNDLIEKLYRKNQFVVIKQWLTTSARRYEEYGVWKVNYLFFRIHLKKWFGAGPEELHSYYQQKINS